MFIVLLPFLFVAVCCLSVLLWLASLMLSQSCWLELFAEYFMGIWGINYLINVYCMVKSLELETFKIFSWKIYIFADA